ncbi:MAG: phosphoenolpyruvate carboxykinase (ATP), partial [Phycisphaerales bacterium]
MAPSTLPVQFGSAKLHANLSVASLVELALARGEGQLAANGALQCDTGERTGRSPDDKFLEDTAGIHGNINWGKVNQAISPEHFEKLKAAALAHLNAKSDVFRFDGYAGADPKFRLKVSVFTEKAWHSLFAKTLFINVPDAEMGAFKADWTIINACGMKIDNPAEFGLKTHIGIAQSLEKKTVIIVGTEYAGEMKKSIFYAMNYDLPDMGVFPMHCSCNVDRRDPANVALFFGLSGTGKTTLSADPNRDLVGDDEHGWSDEGVFNVEGG